MLRSFQRAGILMRRSPYQALAAIFVVWITFTLANIFAIVMFGSQRLLLFFETRPQVIAFFQPTTTEVEIDTIATDVRSKPYVTQVKVVSKDDALRLYKEENAKDPMLLDLVTADILPASIEVSADSSVSLGLVRDHLNLYADKLDEVIFQKDFVDALSRWANGIRLAGSVLVGVLVFSSIVVVTVLVGMKVGTRRAEISIMRLLGATDGYVFGPFLMEGMFYGFVGSVLGWLVSVTLLLYATPAILDFVGAVPILPFPSYFYLAQVGISTFGGIVLGLCSSTLALRRIAR